MLSIYQIYENLQHIELQLYYTYESTYENLLTCENSSLTCDFSTSTIPLQFECFIILKYTYDVFTIHTIKNP